MDKPLNMALVGASGVVGQKILQLLQKKDIKIDNLFPLGKSTVGQTISFQNQDYIIDDLDSFDPKEANITIFSAGGSVAKKHAKKFVESGSYVIDLSSEFRYEDDIPLIIPEINGDIVENLKEPTLIANPNCSTSQLLMVRPANFSSNTETLETNKFQSGLNVNDSQESIQSLAIEEFDNMVNLLRDHQITIFDVDDIKELHNTDALFPNNWVTFHQDNTAVIYPMMAKSRRKEKRNDILKYLEEFESFRIEKVIDLSYLEKDGFFLEGTGSMVLDRINKIVFACKSSRTSINALEVFCKKLNYSSVVFEAVNDDLPIYHTNVMMSLGQETAFICSESIKDQKENKCINKLFRFSERTIIERATN